jgi:ribosomal protein S11
MKKFVLFFCSSILVFVVGCADGPYRITAEGSTYYAKQIERGKNGMIKFTDAVSNAQMTLYDQPGTFEVKTEKIESTQFSASVAAAKAHVKK